MTFELPEAKSVAVNPSQAEMREWALELMDDATLTEFDNVNYKARILARQAPSSFFVSDEPNAKQTMSRADAAEWAAKQDAFIADQDMVLIEGYIGPDPEFRTGSRLFIEKANSNIPAMQQQLYFDRDDAYEPEFTVIYTPSLRAPEFPNECLILTDLDNYVTRVFGSDYFGESKMGGLKMWNKLVYDRGGLAMHSGAKTFPADQTPDGEEKLALIIGLSGTGKTTTTFRNVLGSQPVQDDFIGLMPGGQVYTTEDGCFAKTYGLNAEDEPQIHGGATSPKAWLESTGCDPETGKVDFFDDSYTKNGRCTFGLDMIDHRDPRGLPKANYLFILNRNEDIIPAIAKLKPEQAAYYFMLGETKGTAAGGAAEAGKKLRVPGTNPFWFENDASQANRLLELLETNELEVFLLNTGRVGGGDDHEGSKKVRIPDSAAVQHAVVNGNDTWVEDPDFGYLVLEELDGVEADKLQPRKLYEDQGRGDEYAAIVEKLKADRTEYMAKFEDKLDARVLKGGDV